MQCECVGVLTSVSEQRELSVELVFGGGGVASQPLGRLQHVAIELVATQRNYGQKHTAHHNTAQHSEAASTEGVGLG